MMTNSTIRSYSELIHFLTFEERFDYLSLSGMIGTTTFGFDRYLNQKLYTSTEWNKIRNHVIVRDNSCDLGILERDIFKWVVVHHMNPITIEDLEEGRDIVLDPEFLICTSRNTHNAIHFGNKDSLVKLPIERRKGDTTPWKVY